MPTVNLLYSHSFAITDKITLRIPTVGQVLAHEDDYNSVLSVWTSVPSDYMVFLDDNGIDFASMTDYDLFISLSQCLKTIDTSIVFGDLDFSQFSLAEDTNTHEVVFLSRRDDIVISKGVYYTISAALRKLNGLIRKNVVPAGEETRRYMLERERIKMKRRKNKKEVSQLESLIVAMVNAEQYKYNYEETRSLTIYQFYESAKQVIKKVDYHNRMIGVYAGTVDPKHLSDDDLNWLTHK